MYGKLLAFLRDRRTRSHYFNFSDSTASLTSRDLTVFAYCVARGMDFLVSKKVRSTLPPLNGAPSIDFIVVCFATTVMLSTEFPYKRRLIRTFR